MNIFECLDYRTWMREWLKAQPKEGRGELSRIAQYLEVNSTLVSQVLSGSREFSLEQGHKLCQFFSLNALETRYFMLLLHRQRAGSSGLKSYYQAELQELKKQAGLVESRLQIDVQISDAEKSFVVSSWKPTALLVFAGKASGVTLQEVSHEFSLSEIVARNILEQLVSIGLIQQKAGRFHAGFKRLHMPKGSSFLLRHYTNWRLRAIERSEEVADDEVMYTSVSSIAEADIPKLREKMLQWISDYAKNVTASPAEKVVCLNLDFFRI